jgi:small subunit ribosomal protein S16
MLAIRLARAGKRNKAQFKIALQERTVAPGGRHVEILGSYDPHSKKLTAKKERIEYWISKGAWVSDSLNNLLVINKIISGKKRPIKISFKKVEEKPKEAPKEKIKNEETPKKVEEKPNK